MSTAAHIAWLNDPVPAAYGTQARYEQIFWDMTILACQEASMIFLVDYVDDEPAFQATLKDSAVKNCAVMARRKKVRDER